MLFGEMWKAHFKLKAKAMTLNPKLTGLLHLLDTRLVHERHDLSQRLFGGINFTWQEELAGNQQRLPEAKRSLQ